MSRGELISLPDLPYRALAAPDRRALLERLAARETIPRPTTVVAHHIHIPLLVDEGLVVETDAGLARGPRFDAVVGAFA